MPVRNLERLIEPLTVEKFDEVREIPETVNTARVLAKERINSFPVLAPIFAFKHDASKKYGSAKITRKAKKHISDQISMDEYVEIKWKGNLHYVGNVTGSVNGKDYKVHYLVIINKDLV